MNETHLKSIFNQFEHQHHFVSISELNSGHINDTYLVKTDGDEQYVLQKINEFVFKDVPGLVRNKSLISNHIKSKFTNLSDAEIHQKNLSFVKVKNEELYYYKADLDFWNLMIFINDSKTFEIVTEKKIAYEAGKLSGNFLNFTSDFDASQLIEVIPNFHDMSFRFQQYNASLEKAKKERLTKAENYILKIAALKEEMHILQNLKNSGKIKTRVTHNDTKVSNSLFNQQNKGICMIDTDTVMPGIIQYDFGDAIRTICNTASEDEKDLSKVEFNFVFYKEYLKGFLEETNNSITSLEIKYLPLAAKTMIFIMALRFLTDYLNNDIYYKTTYVEHNLDRAKNQFKLIESLEKHFLEHHIKTLLFEDL